ncbi:MAG: sigma 54-interacting transcriptional regulator, partial [Myxococcales bacterium]|nr:sigma 54-interacting transcriptional regulator [Myxococcales bacterium]
MGKKFPDYVPPTQIAYLDDEAPTLHLRKCRISVERDGRWVERTFDQAVVNIGAMDDNDLVLPEDTVSRFHCRIYQEDNAYVIQDLGSTNGTFVNKVRVKEAYLRPGCQISLGKARIEFQSVDEKVRIQPSADDRYGDIIGNNVKMRQLFGILEKIAPTDTTVVIEGETGTGKEVVARILHANSARAQRPFVAVNVAALPAELLESELFGHGKGAFTGAGAAHRGLFEAAHEGTLFLDEI